MEVGDLLFTKRNNNFTIATGRDLENSLKCLPGLNLKIPAILTNGAVLADLKSGEILLYHSIPENFAHKIIDLAFIFRLTPMVYAFYHKNSNKVLFLKGKWGKIPLIALDRKDYNQHLDSPCISIQFHAKRDVIHKFYEQISLNQ